MKRLRVEFKKYGYVETDYDEELVKFLDTVPNNSCNDSDKHVFESYYSLQWPSYPSVINETIQEPDEYIGYSFIEY